MAEFWFKALLKNLMIGELPEMQCTCIIYSNNVDLTIAIQFGGGKAH